ncbi:A-kinase anchor protein 3-like protein [Corchorus capsularis]|uniref:A-kinase anchor protein 3-like protein n=1 Tax=Corchorus capsularis TaxID=210143 RepID=A0A1R3HZU1_COCAP|nr:A-kinase anchor protein 3-like protein [Corchorus capsularis]
MSPPSTKPSSAASTLTVNASSKPRQNPRYLLYQQEPETRNLETPKKSSRSSPRDRKYFNSGGKRHRPLKLSSS